MVLPERISLKAWAASLVIDYPNDNIPLLFNEKQWKDWGNLLVQEDSFSDNNAPGTGDFNDWQSWAKAVFYVMQ
jgi:hypothetical protein